MRMLKQLGGLLLEYKLWWILPITVIGVLFAVLLYVTSVAGNLPFLYQTY